MANTITKLANAPTTEEPNMLEQNRSPRFRVNQNVFVDLQFTWKGHAFSVPASGIVQEIIDPAGDLLDYEYLVLIHLPEGPSVTERLQEYLLTPVSKT